MQKYAEFGCNMFQNDAKLCNIIKKLSIVTEGMAESGLAEISVAVHTFALRSRMCFLQVVCIYVN